MRILVTGGAGFLGSHLAERLVTDGHRVTAIDDLSTGRLANLAAARTHKGFYVHRFDVADPDLVDLIARERPDVVCHLASLRSGDAVRDAAANVGGTVNLLQACVRTEVPRVLLASDATAVYAPSPRPVTERAGVRPHDAFGAAKIAAEAYLESCEQTLTGVVLRLATIYGPGARQGVVARFAHALTHGRRGTVYGSTARDLLYVDDAVDAFLRCLGGKADGRRLNIGTGSATTIRDLHTRVASLAKAADAPEFGPARSEPATVAAESSAARRALGWEPEVTLDDGLAATVEWQAQQR